MGINFQNEESRFSLTFDDKHKKSHPLIKGGFFSTKLY